MNTPSHSSSRWKAILILLLVFALGIGCGVGGGLLVLRRIVQQAIAHPDGAHAPADRLVGRVEALMAADLNLTAAERSAVHAELLQTAAELKALRLEVWQKTGTTVTDSLDRICKHLPAEKQALLRKKTAERLGPWGLLRDRP